jgi:hypothetical protein
VLLSRRQAVAEYAAALLAADRVDEALVVARRAAELPAEDVRGRVVGDRVLAQALAAAGECGEARAAASAAVRTAYASQQPANARPPTRPWPRFPPDRACLWRDWWRCVTLLTPVGYPYEPCRGVTYGREYVPSGERPLGLPAVPGLTDLTVLAHGGYATVYRATQISAFRGSRSRSRTAPSKATRTTEVRA